MADEKTVQEGLEEALKDTPETSPDKSDKAPNLEAKGTDKGQKPGPVPYDRFQEVNAKMRELEGALEQKETELDERAKALEKLSGILEAKEQYVQIVENLRDLYRSGDPEWKGTLEKLERKLQGVEEEVEAGDKTEKQGEKESQRLIKETAARLEDSIADQRADLIVGKAHTLAAQYLAGLPEEYSDTDKERIAEAWTNAVDWESVEAADDWSEALEQELPNSLEAVLAKYGEPQGVLVARTLESLKEKGVVEEKSAPVSPQERLDKILSRNWGELKESKDAKGNTVYSPVLSDDEFAREAGAALKAGNEAARLIASKG
jgi:DNA repair exonuclease SbcCD ATPase subunit